MFYLQIYPSYYYYKTPGICQHFTSFKIQKNPKYLDHQRPLLKCTYHFLHVKQWINNTQLFKIIDKIVNTQ